MTKKFKRINVIARRRYNSRYDFIREDTDEVVGECWGPRIAGSRSFGMSLHGIYWSVRLGANCRGGSAATTRPRLIDCLELANEVINNLENGYILPYVKPEPPPAPMDAKTEALFDFIVAWEFCKGFPDSLQDRTNLNIVYQKAKKALL